MTIKPTNTLKGLRLPYIRAPVLFKALLTAAVYIHLYFTFSFVLNLFQLVSWTVLLFGLEHAVHTFFATEF
jgi:hypothetical protein